MHKAELVDLPGLQYLEDLVCEEFRNPAPGQYYRGGRAKTSFIYLLLDSRITLNLPKRFTVLDDDQAFRTFIRSVFYIGKGTATRPLQHLREALNFDLLPSEKTKKILNIWEEGAGVVNVQVFHNSLAMVAYTREAAIIDAVGDFVTNIQRGCYYGSAATWPEKSKRLLGVTLLYKAYKIFLTEGEQQIRLCDM